MSRAGSCVLTSCVIQPIVGWLHCGFEDLAFLTGDGFVIQPILGWLHCSLVGPRLNDQHEFAGQQPYPGPGVAAIISALGAAEPL
jgi:hypothetical protein